MQTELIVIGIKEGRLIVNLNLVLFLLAILLPLGLLLAKRLIWWNTPDVELNIKLGRIGEVKLKPNHDVKQIAHQAWVELKTRKAGLPIDEKNDVIADIYKSWYQLFGEIRLLARNIPASKLKNPDTQRLVEILIDSLNDGLRPHLTRWQAKYSRWYSKAVDRDEHSELTPQDIQRKYPEFMDLVDDMLKINKQLVQYTDEIKKIVDA